MPRVEFEPMITVFERQTTVHALDSAATAIGTGLYVQSPKCLHDVMLN
jgi:hypothetical protein